MFIASIITSPQAPFEGAEDNWTLPLETRPTPSNGAGAGVALGSIDISPLTRGETCTP